MVLLSNKREKKWSLSEFFSDRSAYILATTTTRNFIQQHLRWYPINQFSNCIFKFFIFFQRHNAQNQIYVSIDKPENLILKS